METLHAVLRFLAQDPTGWIMAATPFLVVTARAVIRRLTGPAAVLGYEPEARSVPELHDFFALAVDNPGRRPLRVTAIRLRRPRRAAIVGLYDWLGRQPGNGMPYDEAERDADGLARLVEPGATRRFGVDVAGLPAGERVLVELVVELRPTDSPWPWSRHRRRARLWLTLPARDAA